MTHLKRDCPHFQARMKAGRKTGMPELLQQFMESQTGVNRPNMGSNPRMLALPSGPSATGGPKDQQQTDESTANTSTMGQGPRQGNNTASQ